ncbi:MAG: hypothetical protein ACPGVB_01680 [Chitinophagales bacterium]
MSKSNTRIIVIDDLPQKIHPIIFNLERYYKEVISITSTHEGVEYVKAHIHEKNIVILDYLFSSNEPTGLWVLQQIREVSKLIPVILLTENKDKIEQEKYPELINLHIAGFADKSNYLDVIEKVQEAEKELNTGIDTVLEDWINKQDEEDKAQDILIPLNGKSYTLNDIVKAIRAREPIGLEFEKTMQEYVLELIVHDAKTK